MNYYKNDSKKSYRFNLYYKKLINVGQVLKRLFFTLGVLTNLTSKTADYNQTEKTIERRESIGSNVLDDSLVSIQDSISSFCSALNNSKNEAHLEKPETSNLSCEEAKADSVPEPMKLEDLCNPNKFTIELNADDGKKKTKITKDDFFKATNKNKDISNDPFFSLDPLRKQ